MDEIEVYNKNAILNELKFTSPVEESILNDIITLYDKEIGEAIKRHLVVQIPYIGSIRKSRFYEEFSKKKTLLHLSRKYKTKEEYKEFAREVAKEAYKTANEKDRKGVIIRKIRGQNKKEYETLCKKIGKAYADMYIFAKSSFKVIPFDEDIEAALQEIWIIENET